MKTLYAYEKNHKNISPSIFLAGPSPRKLSHPNWRTKALEVLEKIKFEGAVYVPLPRSGEWLENYDAQVEWELEHLKRATIIVFWIPRNLKTLPAFTTNVEYGLYASSGKIVLGFPENAPKMRYIKHLAVKYDAPVFHTLKETLEKSVELTAI